MLEIGWVDRTLGKNCDTGERGEYQASDFLNELKNGSSKHLNVKSDNHSIDEIRASHENKNNPEGKCNPLCGKGTIKQNTAFGCSEWKNGCHGSVSLSDKKLFVYYCCFDIFRPNRTQEKQSEPEQFLYFGFDTDVFNKSSKLIGSGTKCKTEQEYLYVLWL